MGEKVSISCRRHHSRVFVDAEWADKCSWLCPRCYEKLSERERKKLAPKTTEKHMSTTALKQHHNHDVLPQPKPFRIEDFKPRNKIHCRMCGEDFPCQPSWFEVSKVLCPQCAAKMTMEQINTYNRLHEGQPIEVTQQVKKKLEEVEAKQSKKRHNLFVDTGRQDMLFYSRTLSQDSIGRFGKEKLLKSVAEGKISRVRARIELRRRRNSSYYNELPEVHGVTPGYR